MRRLDGVDARPWPALDGGLGGVTQREEPPLAEGPAPLTVGTVQPGRPLQIPREESLLEEIVVTREVGVVMLRHHLIPLANVVRVVDGVVVVRLPDGVPIR